MNSFTNFFFGASSKTKTLKELAGYKDESFIVINHNEADSSKNTSGGFELVDFKARAKAPPVASTPAKPEDDYVEITPPSLPILNILESLIDSSYKDEQKIEESCHDVKLVKLKNTDGSQRDGEYFFKRNKAEKSSLAVFLLMY